MSASRTDGDPSRTVPAYPVARYAKDSRAETGPIHPV